MSRPRWSRYTATRTNLDYTSSSGQQLQSAITVIDNETGNLVGIAGRVGEKTGNLWMNFATDSKRQPGSSIKPLSVYAPAFEMGLISPTPCWMTIPTR